MKRALISVFDKTGVVELALALVELDYEVISTGGTARLLQEKGVPVTMVSDITESPEVMDGRVKTLHPRVHGGILARNTSEHLADLETIGGSLIDVVAVNLYPFEAVSQDPTTPFDEVIENIDIGGPTLLRSAAKNHERVLVLSDPSDYADVVDEIRGNQVSPKLRQVLASKAFAHTAYYDTLIADYLGTPEFPQKRTIALQKSKALRYGENPHQSAAFYREVPALGGLAVAEQLHGKQLSFNNIFDGDAAWQMVSAFSEPTVVGVKHTNPCGLATASSLSEAFAKVYSADPVSIFGGIVACNRAVDLATAEQLSKVFLEVVIAPDFHQDALSLLQKKANLRLLKLDPAQNRGHDWKKVTGGVLIQQGDTVDVVEDKLQVVTQRQPSAAEMTDLYFAWKVVKYVKSNAIVLCKNNQLLGVGAGQMNRVQSMELAVNQSGDNGIGGVIGSDAFFPFADNIEVAAKAGVKAIIQPGGSKRDQEVIDCCDKHGISMVFTGIRHFRH